VTNSLGYATGIQFSSNHLVKLVKN
jgi:hypothetical protein